MSKTAIKTGEPVENFEFPAFDPSKATDQLRSIAEQGVEQSKEAYAKMKTGAEEAQKAIEFHFRDREVGRQRTVAEDDCRDARQCRGQFLAPRSTHRR